MAQPEEKGHAYGGDEICTEDGSVDLKGRHVLRSKTGRWKACSFVIGYELFERLAYQGILANLVLYLTRELHQGTVTASNNVTNWNGAMWMTPILGAYIADAYLGRFWTTVLGSAIYLTGMVLLTLAVSVPAFRPPSCTTHDLKEENCPKASSLQVGIFFAALYILTVGNGGTKPNVPSMGVQQFDEFEPKEKIQKISFFNWFAFSALFGFLISESLLVYIQDNVGWSLGYGLPTAALAVAIIIFLSGTPFYRHKLPSGSPFTRIAKVLVSAFRKWKVTLPDDPKELYELSPEEYAKNGMHRIDHTLSFRFLDKAAVRTGKNMPWALCPVTQVEETKQIVKLLPVFLATFIPATVTSQSHTLFIKQGTTLERSMGPRFDIPPACLTVFYTFFVLISIVIYDRCLVPAIQQHTKNPRAITMLQRLGIGVFLHVIVTITAFFTERKRLSVARKNGIVGKHETVPLTVFILLPQFALMGIADSFLEIGKMDFFYDQAPQGMKSLASSFPTTSRGVGSFLSSFVLSSVSEVTNRRGHKGWILNNLNVSHIDYYYAFLAVLAFLNFLFFLLVTKLFVYNAEAKKSNMDSDGLETLHN